MVASIEDRVAALEREVRDLRARIDRPEVPREPAPPPSLLVRTTVAPPPPDASPPSTPPASPPARTPRQEPRSVDLEELLGGRLLALAGGAAVLVGLAFLVALAIDRGWIGEWTRVSLAFSGSLALLAAGVWLYERRGRSQAALATVGTAVAGLFVAVTAGGSLYGLVPDAVALAAALAVGATAAGLAVRWQSRTVAALGIGGALLAPLYAASFPTPEALAYLVIAYSASAGVLVWQKWEWLRVGSFALVALQLGAWVVSGDPVSASTFVVALSLFGLVGVTLACGYELRVPAQGLRPSTSFLVVLNALVVGGLGVAWLGFESGERTAGLWMAAVAASHAAAGLGLLRIRPESRHVAYLLLGTSLVAADIAFALLTSGATLAIGWAASAVALAILGRLYGEEGGLVPLTLGGQLALAITHTVLFQSPADALLGAGAVPYGPLVAIGAAGFTCARLARPTEEGWRVAADATALVTLAYVTAASLGGLELVAAWGAEAVALAQVGRRTRDRVADVGAFAFLALAGGHALAVEAPPIGLVDGLAALVPAAAALAVVAGVAGRLAATSGGAERRVLSLASGTTVLYAVSLVLVTLLQPGAGAFESTGTIAVSHQAQAVLTGFWALCGLALLWVGLRRDERLLRLSGFGLLSLAVAKVFLFDMAALDSGWRILSFVVLGLLLLASAFAYQRMARDGRRLAT